MRHNGEIKWRGQLLYLSEVLAKEPVGLKPHRTKRWELRYSFHLLGVLDERNKKLPQLKAGTELSAKKCKPCPRSKT